MQLLLGVLLHKENLSLRRMVKRKRMRKCLKIIIPQSVGGGVVMKMEQLRNNGSD
jgi:hypothetical protein